MHLVSKSCSPMNFLVLSIHKKLGSLISKVEFLCGGFLLYVSIKSKTVIKRLNNITEGHSFDDLVNGSTFFWVTRYSHELKSLDIIRLTFVTLRWSETRTLKLLISDNVFLCHLMVMKLCTVIKLGNT